MNHQEPHDPLLNQVLGDEALESLRERSLEAGLSELRSARRRRSVRRSTGVAMLVALLGFWIRSTKPELAPAVGLATRALQTVPAVPPSASQSTPLSPNPVATLTDEELFALFPAHSLALVGKHGSQQLAVLDDPSPR